MWKSTRQIWRAKEEIFGITTRSDGVLKTIDEKEQLSRRRTEGTHREYNWKYLDMHFKHFALKEIIIRS